MHSDSSGFRPSVDAGTSVLSDRPIFSRQISGTAQDKRCLSRRVYVSVSSNSHETSFFRKFAFLKAGPPPIIITMISCEMNHVGQKLSENTV